MRSQQDKDNPHRGRYIFWVFHTPSWVGTTAYNRGENSLDCFPRKPFDQNLKSICHQPQSSKQKRKMGQLKVPPEIILKDLFRMIIFSIKTDRQFKDYVRPFCSVCIRDRRVPKSHWSAAKKLEMK